MKNIFKTIGALVLSSVIFTACNEDDNTGLSTIDYSPVSVTLSSSENNTIISENTISDDGYTIEITATIAEEVPVDLHIPLTQTGGNALSGHDYNLESTIVVIKKGFTTGSTVLTVYSTGDQEADESLTIGLDTNIPVANATVSPFSLNVDLTDDYVDYTFSVEFAWDGYVFPETEEDDSDLSFCDGLDLDFLLLDGSFSDTGVYDAATAACPESIDIDPTAYADGTYYFYADLYGNTYEAAGYDVAVPISITYSQGYEGDLLPITTEAPSLMINTDDGAGAGDMVIEFEIAAGIVTSVTVL